MTAAELIKELQAIPPDTLIAVYADHGQMCCKATTSGLQKVHNIKKHFLEVVFEGEEVDEVIYSQVFEIGAP